MYVFHGDYTDHWDRSDIEILNNLKEIIQFKRHNPNSVKLLIGNHDMQYMFGSLYDLTYYCSGFRPSMFWDLYHLFTTNTDLFEMAWSFQNYLFTHAGVITKWYEKREPMMRSLWNKYNQVYGEKHEPSVAELINFTFLLKERYILWDVGYATTKMRGDIPGPLWCRPREMEAYQPLLGYNQVVGHTPCDDVYTQKYDNGQEVTFCDCLDKTDNYFSINL